MTHFLKATLYGLASSLCEACVVPAWLRGLSAWSSVVSLCGVAAYLRGCVAAWYASVVGCVVKTKSACKEATFVSGLMII